MSFLSAYFNIVEDAAECAVLCPFPHDSGAGVAYYESRPSAHVNTFERLFHCKSCGVGHNETSFIQAILGCDIFFAKKLIRCFENNETKELWEAERTLTEEQRLYLNRLGISNEVAEELQLIGATIQGNHTIRFPVFLYNHLIDVRSYTPFKTPKLSSRTECPTGIPVPYDIWRESPKTRITLICAGEKDMAVARTHGFNAITLTGGELKKPEILEEFKDRAVVICYDNDSAGIRGASNLARVLHPYCKGIKICTEFHKVCIDKGEDITDYFVKYNKTAADLKQCISITPDYVPDTTSSEYTALPVVDLFTASQAKYINKLVRSNVQVVAVNDASFSTPTAIMAEKFRLHGTGDTMQEGEVRTWELQDKNIQDLLHLVDNNFKESTIQLNIRNLMRILEKEKYVKFNNYRRATIHKAVVTDLFESSTSDVIPMEYTAYSKDIKLESGKRYLVTHKIVPHPYKGQQLTMLIVDVEQANDSVSNFRLNEETKAHLDTVRLLPGTVAERMDALTQKVKGLLGYNGNNVLIQTIDLAFHTVLQFHFGAFKNVRGYLDTLIVGESRVGKSNTADTLRQTYGLGVFASLAGNAATIAGLIGGSNKTSGGQYQTRAGMIPQNHKGLIVFEEFGKSNSNIATELTDIRSSNEVRITRVSGNITMPALVRMITLTNVKAVDGHIKPIASYPHGISVITELVGTAEDIARYDLMLVLADKGNAQIDPFWTPEEPLSTDVYKTRIRWVWSRTPEQVILDKETMLYIMEYSNKLNEVYDTHIKIFGTEAWKKLSRLAIAIAAYLVSTDDTYENIVVTKEHVEYAAEYLVRIYDNPTFKLKEYVFHERQFSTIDENGIALLQDMYNKNPSMLLQLEQTTRITKNMLAAGTGLTSDEVNKFLGALTRGLFVRYNNHDILPTERFRLGMSAIKRGTYIPRVGEANAEVDTY